MTTGERMTWCQGCGGLFPDGVPQHHCVGRVQFAPYPADHRPGGAFAVPLLTEDRVRQIVREELERASGVKGGQGG